MRSILEVGSEQLSEFIILHYTLHSAVCETVLLVALVQMMTSCMNSLGIDAYIQQLLQGIVIVLILGFDCFGRMRKRENV